MYIHYVASLCHSELLDNFNYASRPEEYGKWDAYGKSKVALMYLSLKFHYYVPFVCIFLINILITP